MFEHIIYIMRGLPGSGKSHRANIIANPKDIYSTDDFWLDDDGNYEYIKQRAQQAHLWNQDRVKTAMRKRRHKIVVDNTNLNRLFIRPYTDLAERYNYKIVYVEPDSPWWVAMVDELDEHYSHTDVDKHIQTLMSHGKHEVPYETMRMMWDGWTATKFLNFETNGLYAK